MKTTAATLDYIPGRERAGDDLVLPTRLGPRARRILICLALLSLILFLASATAWMHSIHRRDMLAWAGWKDQKNAVWQGCGIAGADGALIVYGFSGGYQFDDPFAVGAGPPTMQPHFLRISLPYSAAGVPKFKWMDSQFGQPPLFRIRLASIPFWLPTLVFAIAPAAWLVVVLRRARRETRRGFPVCDITSNLDLSSRQPVYKSPAG